MKSKLNSVMDPILTLPALLLAWLKRLPDSMQRKSFEPPPKQQLQSQHTLRVLYMVGIFLSSHYLIWYKTNWQDTRNLQPHLSDHWPWNIQSHDRYFGHQNSALTLGISDRTFSVSESSSVGNRHLHVNENFIPQRPTVIQRNQKSVNRHLETYVKPTVKNKVKKYELNNVINKSVKKVKKVNDAKILPACASIKEKIFNLQDYT